MPESLMKVRVLGCSGGVSRGHAGVSFLIDGCVGLDAGSLASGLTLAEQRELDSILLTHSHLDHVGDLGALADTRLQQGHDPLDIAGTAETIDALRAHFFNDVLWPDFARLPDEAHPTITFRTLELEMPQNLCGLQVLPVAVEHSVPSCGFLLGHSAYRLAYSGDTGPTHRFWEVMRAHPSLRVLITEVSFPDEMAELAARSGHLTPATFAGELEKLAPSSDLRILVYGMKPNYVDEITTEIEALGIGAELLVADTAFEV